MGTLTLTNPDPPDAEEGAEYVGQSVWKQFGYDWYQGTVESYDLAAGFFRVTYPDGDSRNWTCRSFWLTQCRQNPPVLTLTLGRENGGGPCWIWQKYELSTLTTRLRCVSSPKPL